MEKQAVPNIFAQDTTVEILQDGEVIDRATVIEDSRDEIRLRSKELDPGTEMEFAFKKDLNAWKLFFEGLGGERCTNPNAPSYVIRVLPETKS